MKSLLIGLLALVGVEVASAQSYNCTTQSNGYYFQQSGWDYYSTRQAVVNQCKSHYYTSNSQCEYNAQCNGGGGGGGGGYGQINAYKQYCQGNGLCTYSLNWSVGGWGGGSVLTVQIPGETGEKLMACEGQYGQAQAPWVAIGKQYVFRLYNNSGCYIGGYPVNQITVYGGQ